MRQFKIPGIFAVGLGLYLATVLFLHGSHKFNRESFEREHRHKLLSQAAGLRAAIESLVRSQNPDLEGAEGIDKLMGEFEEAFEFESITLLDEIHSVIYSTNPFLESGMSENLKLTEAEEEELFSGATTLRPLTNIEGSLFRTILIPVKLGEGRGVVQADVNLNYLDKNEIFEKRYRLGLILSLALFVGGMSLILYIIFLLGRSEKKRAADEKLALMGKMTASIAHEIKNPLGIIKSTAQVIEKKYADSNKKDEVFGYIGEEIDKLNQNITDYLTYSRDITLRPEFLDLEEAVDKVLRHFPEVKFSAGGVGRIKYDPFRFTQLLRNLIFNAQNHGGGDIAVATEKSGTDALLTLSDGGRGIPPDKMEKIFEPFHSTAPQGTGLGLSIVKKIAEAHGGRISVKNNPGAGATFTLFIKGPIS